MICSNKLLLVASLILISFPGIITSAERDYLPGYRGKSPVIENLIPGFMAVTAASFMLDEPVMSFVRSNQTPFLQGVANYTDMGGEKTIVVPALLLTYGTARLLLNDKRLQSAALNSVQSVIVTAIATEGMKNLAGRARPFTGEGAYSFHRLPIGIDRYKSLPSGHVSLAFALFTPFAETYSRWIYLVPVSVAMGRVYQEKHWVSDAIVGGGIGLLSGLLFTHNERIQIIPTGIRVYF